MSSPALALIGSGGRIEQSTETFRRRYEDLAKQSPQLDSVLTGESDRAMVTLDGVSAEIEAVTDVAGMRHALLTVTDGAPAPVGQEDNALLAESFDDSPAIIWLKDLEGRYLKANDRYGAVLGTTFDALQGKTDAELAPRATVDGPRLEDGGGSASEPLAFEYTVPAFEGRPALAALRFPVRDRTGEPVAVCGVAAPLDDAGVARAEAARLIEVERWSAVDAGTVRHEVMSEWGVMADGDGPAIGTPSPAAGARPAAPPSPPSTAAPAETSGPEQELTSALAAERARAAELERTLAQAQARLQEVSTGGDGGSGADPAELALAREELAQVRAQAEQARADAEAARAEAEAARRETAEALLHAERVEGNAEEWREQAETAEAGGHGLRARLEQAEAEAKQSRARLEQAEADAQHSRARLEQAEADTQQARMRMEQAEVSAQQARMRMEQAESEARALRTRLEQAETAAQQARTRAEGAEADAVGLRTRLEHAEADALQSRVRLEEADAAASAARGRQEAAETELRGVRTRLEESESNARALRSRADQAESALQQSRTRMEEAEASARTLRSRLEEAEAETRSLRVQLTEAEAGTGGLRARLDDAEADARGLRTRLEEAEADHVALRTRLEAAETTAATARARQEEAEASARDAARRAEAGSDNPQAAVSVETEAALKAALVQREAEAEVARRARTEAESALAAARADMEERLAAAEAQVEVLQAARAEAEAALAAATSGTDEALTSAIAERDAALASNADLVRELEEQRRQAAALQEASAAAAARMQELAGALVPGAAVPSSLAGADTGSGASISVAAPNPQVTVAAVPAPTRGPAWPGSAQQALVSTLAGASDWRAGLEEALKVLGASGGWDVVRAWAPDEPGSLRCTAMWTAFGGISGVDALAAEAATAGGGSVLAQAIAAPAVTWLADLETADDEELGAAAARGMSSAVLLPIRDGGATIGLLELLTRAEVDPDPQLALALEAAALQLGRFAHRLRS